MGIKIFILGPQLAVLCAYSWLGTQRSLLTGLGIIWAAGDKIWIFYLQGKTFPTSASPIYLGAALESYS